MSSSKEWDFFLGHTKRSTKGETESFVKLIYRALTEREFRTFYDRESLPGGTIDDCLHAATSSFIHVVFLDDCTPDSKWVVKEILQSIRANNLMVTVYRKDKFTWDQIGKALWEERLAYNADEFQLDADAQKEVTKGLFASPAIDFDYSNMKLEKFWTDQTLERLEKLYAKANPSYVAKPRPPTGELTKSLGTRNSVETSGTSPVGQQQVYGQPAMAHQQSAVYTSQQMSPNAMQMGVVQPSMVQVQMVPVAPHQMSMHQQHTTTTIKTVKYVGGKTCAAIFLTCFCCPVCNLALLACPMDEKEEVVTR